MFELNFDENDDLFSALSAPEPTSEVVDEEVEEVVEEVETESEEEIEQHDGEDEESEEEETVEDEEVDEDVSESDGISVKIDGVEHTVTLEELKSVYQMERAADARLNQAKDIRNTYKAKMTELESVMPNLSQIAMDQTAKLDQALQRWDGISQHGWAAMRAENPELFATEYTEFMNTVEAKNQVIAHQNALNQQLRNYFDTERGNAIEQMRFEYPGYDFDDVMEYAKGKGFAESQINQWIDPKIHELTYKAMLHDKAKKLVSSNEKRSVEKSKTVKHKSKPQKGSYDNDTLMDFLLRGGLDS